MNKLAPYAKAITAALVAGLSVLLATNNWDRHAIVSALVAFLVGLGAVWAVPNKPAAARPTTLAKPAARKRPNL